MYNVYTGLGSSGTQQGPVAGSCKKVNELLEIHKVRENFD